MTKKYIPPRACKYCGRDLTRTRFKTVCHRGECKEKQYQDRLAERRKGNPKPPKEERKHHCKRCGRATSNLINCPHCVKILSNTYAPGAEDVSVGWI